MSNAINEAFEKWFTVREMAEAVKLEMVGTPELRQQMESVIRFRLRRNKDGLYQDDDTQNMLEAWVAAIELGDKTINKREPIGYLINTNPDMLYGINYAAVIFKDTNGHLIPVYA